MMTHHELARIRRQMHQRIRLVLTQRRLLAAEPGSVDYVDRPAGSSPRSAEPPPKH